MQLQLDRAVLEGLVDAHLIEKRLVLDVGARELRGEIAAIVDPLWSDSASRETLRAMTQASDGSIKKYFLEHEARNQILSSRLQAEGLSLEEIAGSLGISVGAVKANLWQAGDKMRKYLKGVHP